MRERKNMIRWLVLITLSIGYLLNALKIGFWISGDMHSGGPFVGVLLFPLFAALLTLLLFLKEPRPRRISLLVVACYLIIGILLLLLLR